MTKKFTCIAILTCLLATAFAGSAQGLEKKEEQYLEEQYLNEKLIIEAYETLYLYGNQPGFLWNIGAKKGWESYRGGVLLSEEEFYRILDMPEYAKQAKQLKNKRKGLTIGGIAAFGIGMAIFLSNDPSEIPSSSWILMGGGGLSLCYAFSLPNNVTNSIFAAQNAEIYNNKLRKRIFGE